VWALKGIILSASDILVGNIDYHVYALYNYNIRWTSFKTEETFEKVNSIEIKAFRRERYP
jgi:hypothetical protein